VQVLTQSIRNFQEQNAARQATLRPWIASTRALWTVRGRRHRRPKLRCSSARTVGRKKIEQGRQPCSQDANSRYITLTPRTLRDGCGFTPSIPPKTWTAPPMARDWLVARARPRFCEAIRSRRHCHPTQNAAAPCEIAPSLLRRRMRRSTPPVKPGYSARRL